MENNNEQDKCTHCDNKSALAALNLHRTHLIQKLKKARRTLSEQQLKLKVIQTAKGKKEHSVESKMLNVLKKIGVELSSYHGGSLNGKDIKKVMNNASYAFDELAVILKEGKRPGCILPDATLDTMCLHFREVLVHWDGAFLLARTINPMEADIKTYLLYVDAAVHGNAALRFTVTPKVHLMLKHVAWQMLNIRGGLGDKMKIGWNGSTKLGCICNSTFALSRTQWSVRMHARRRVPVSRIRM